MPFRERREAPTRVFSSRGILWRLTIGPTVQDRTQSLHVENGCHFRVLSEALHFFRNVISRPCQPRVPVSSLGAVFLLVKHDIRQPSFHGPSDQPAVTAFAQILIPWNPEAKLNHPPIARRCPNIEAKPGSQLCIPVGRLPIISQTNDSIQPPIAKERRVEGYIFARRSIDYSTSNGKL